MIYFSQLRVTGKGRERCDMCGGVGLALGQEGNDDDDDQALWVKTMESTQHCGRT